MTTCHVTGLRWPSLGKVACTTVARASVNKTVATHLTEQRALEFWVKDDGPSRDARGPIDLGSRARLRLHEERHLCSRCSNDAIGKMDVAALLFVLESYGKLLFFHRSSTAAH